MVEIQSERRNKVPNRVSFTFGKSTNSGFYLFRADGPIRLGHSDVFLGICYRGSGVEIGLASPFG